MIDPQSPAVPSCFPGPEDWAEWRRAAKLHPPNPRLGACEDCTPAHQSRMLAEDRCARPEVRFIRTFKDGLTAEVPGCPLIGRQRVLSERPP